MPTNLPSQCRQNCFPVRVSDRPFFIGNEVHYPVSSVPQADGTTLDTYKLGSNGRRLTEDEKLAFDIAEKMEQQSASPAFVPKLSATGWTGFMEGVRGQTSVMETASTAKTLGGYVHTAGQVLKVLSS